MHSCMIEEREKWMFVSKRILRYIAIVIGALSIVKYVLCSSAYFQQKFCAEVDLPKYFVFGRALTLGNASTSFIVREWHLRDPLHQSAGWFFSMQKSPKWMNVNLCDFIKEFFCYFFFLIRSEEFSNLAEIDYDSYFLQPFERIIR